MSTHQQVPFDFTIFHHSASKPWQIMTFVSLKLSDSALFASSPGVESSRWVHVLQLRAFKLQTQRLLEWRLPSGGAWPLSGTVVRSSTQSGPNLCLRLMNIFARNGQTKDEYPEHLNIFVTSSFLSRGAALEEWHQRPHSDEGRLVAEMKPRVPGNSVTKLNIWSKSILSMFVLLPFHSQAKLACLTQTWRTFCGLD